MASKVIKRKYIIFLSIILLIEQAINKAGEKLKREWTQHNARVGNAYIILYCTGVYHRILIDIVSSGD